MIKQTNVYKASDLVSALEVVLEAKTTDSMVTDGIELGVVFYKDLVMAIGYHKVAIVKEVGERELSKPVAIRHESAEALANALNDNAKWDSEITLSATNSGVSFLIDGSKGKHFALVDNKIEISSYSDIIENDRLTVVRKFGVDSLQDVCYSINTEFTVINEGQLEGINELGHEEQRESVEIEKNDTPFVPTVVNSEFLRNIADSISLSGESEGIMYSEGKFDQIRFVTETTTHILLPTRVEAVNKTVKERASKPMDNIVVPF